MDEDLARKRAKCIEAVSKIILLMRKNGIPIPSKYQKSRVDENLPKTPDAREEEVIRRFRYLEPENRGQMADRLNDLLVYAEVARELKSELIAIIVLSKLEKWENLLLNPDREMPRIPAPSPKERERLLERRKIIEERDRRAATEIRQYEEQGDERRSNLQSYNPFADHVRTITLPPQTIGPPQSQMQGAEAARVNLYEQSRRKIAEYEKFGAIKKKLFFDPEYDRNLKGPKLPDQKLPQTSRNREPGNSEFLYKELAKQKRMDELIRQLKKPLSTLNSNTNDRVPITPSPERKRKHLERKKMIDDRNQRVTNTLRRHELQGEIRRAAVESMDQHWGPVRTIRLPSQTIGPPQSQLPEATPARVNLEEQRQRDIENYRKFGAIRKRMHEMPVYQRDLKGPKLPDHAYPLPSSRDVAAPTPSKFKELEERKALERMRQQLHQTITSRKRKRSNDPVNDDPSEETLRRRKESAEERDRRAASTIRQYEGIGERRRAAVGSRDPFDDHVRTIRLPPQTIPLPNQPSRESAEEMDRRTANTLRQYEEMGGRRRAAVGSGQPLDDHVRTIRLPPQTIPLPQSSRGATEEMDRRAASTIRQYEGIGESRRAAVENRNPFDDHVRTIRLPPQTIPNRSLEPSDATVDLNEQVRRDIEKYEKFGAIKKQLHDMPNFERNLTGPKLRNHGLPSTSTEAPKNQGRFKELDQQRELDTLRRELREALVSRKRVRSNDPENRPDSNPNNDNDTPNGDRPTDPNDEPANPSDDRDNVLDNTDQ